MVENDQEYFLLPEVKSPDIKEEDDWCEEESEYAAQSVMGDAPASMIAEPPNLNLPPIVSPQAPSSLS